jgi:uncharacterized protein
MICEGIVTTLNEDGTANISPMGPHVDAQMQFLVLKPYRTSKTYQNLKRNGEGIFHVTDDVLLLAQAAVGTPIPAPQLLPVSGVNCLRLADTCRWYAFRIHTLDDSEERTKITVDVVERGCVREFFGFNRAKNAVLEAAILATRVNILSPEQTLEPLASLQVLVDKTGGPQEHTAFEFLKDFIQRSLKQI